MILSLCIITIGDEELEMLKGAVGSVINYVDEVCITTNGARTKKTRKFCATNPKIKHSHLDWTDDFSLQRNFNFSQARSDADYILWMDSDDIIVNPQYLRDIAEVSKKAEYDTVFFTYWYGSKFDGEPSLDTFVEVELTQSRERLIRPQSIVWKKRIHETPVPVDSQNFKYSKVEYSKEYPIVWMHLGADRDVSQEQMDKRMARNQRLLEAELEDERRLGKADPRTLLYLMKIYAESNEEETLKKCINLGDEYMAKSGWDQERAICCQLMSRCMGKLGDDAKARDLLHTAIREFPYSPLLYLHLARTYFNLKDYNAMHHWMRIGMSLDVNENNNSMSNILELKILSAELMLEYYMHGKRDIRKAYESARLLNKINPSANNQHNEDYLYDQKELDLASEHTHKYMGYLKDIQREDLIPTVVESMPEEMRRLPFANNFYNRYKSPKIWGDKEICYYATFGGEHFEKWDGNSLKKGIGGSETAVIRLSEEWTKRGYKVTVYGDPVSDMEINGVLYLPWYKFNPRDKFSTFIQWRNSNLAKKISAKRFLVDLHDVFVEDTHIPRLDQIDKLMVKSEYHSGYAPKIADSKKCIVSNGI